MKFSIVLMLVTLLSLADIVECTDGAKGRGLIETNCPVRKNKNSKRLIGGDCPGGKCLFVGCEDPVSCSGGACEMVDCFRPTCDGGRCKFSGCEFPECAGGACLFYDIKTSIDASSCLGRRCLVEEQQIDSDFGNDLAF